MIYVVSEDWCLGWGKTRDVGLWLWFLEVTGRYLSLFVWTWERTDMRNIGRSAAEQGCVGGYWLLLMRLSDVGMIYSLLFTALHHTNLFTPAAEAIPHNSPPK